MKRSLYQITEDLSALDELLEDIGGEVTDEQAEAALDDWFKEYGDELEEKLDAYANVIQMRKDFAAARKAEAKRITALANTDENIVDKLKGRLQQYLESKSDDRKQQKIETPNHKFWIQNNGGVRPVVLTESAEKFPEELPERYRRVRFEVEMNNVRTDFERFEQLCDEIKGQLTIDQIDQYGDFLAPGSLDWHLLTQAKGQDAIDLQPISDKIIAANDLRIALQDVGSLGDRGCNLRIK